MAVGSLSNMDRPGPLLPRPLSKGRKVPPLVPPRPAPLAALVRKRKRSKSK